MNKIGSCWPSPEQLLLLKAGLLETETANAAWQAYCQAVDLTKIDYASSTMLPLVYSRYKKSDTPELQICKSVYRHTWSYNNLQFHQLTQILIALQAKGIEVCLLKGAALIAKYYQNKGVRVMGDMDLLIPKAQVSTAIQTLLNKGWQIITKVQDLEQYLKTMHAISLVNDKGYLLDLHWKIFIRSDVDKFLAQYAYRTDAVTLENKIKTQILSPENLLLHTLVHGLRYSPAPLIRWVPDATVILRHATHFDWDYFFLQVRSIRVMLESKWALLYLQEHQFITLPVEVVKILEAYQPSAQELKHLQIISQTPKKFIFALQLFWSYHVRNQEGKRLWAQLITLPQALKKFTHLDHWHQVLLFLAKRSWFYFKRDILSQKELKM